MNGLKIYNLNLPMQYLLIFLIPPILFNLTWLIDTFLVSKFWEEKGNGNLESWIWTLMIIWWTIAGFVALGLLPSVYQEIFTIQRQSLLYLLFWGIAYGVAAFPYFKALEREQVENILPMYQTVPLFAYILWVLFLWEIIPLRQIFIILWIILLTGLFYIDLKHFTFNKKAVGLCLISVILYAISFVFFKKGGLEEGNLGVSFFWEHIGVMITGLRFFSQSSIRKTTIKYFKQAWWKFSILNIFNEMFFITGIILQNYISLHYLIIYMSIITNGGQVLLWFLMKYLAHRRNPKRYERNYTKTAIVIKISLAIIVLIGLFYISRFIEG